MASESACFQCFKGKKDCLRYRDGSCSACLAAGIQCTPKPSQSKDKGKRKREVVENPAENMRNRTDRASSSITASYEPVDTKISGRLRSTRSRTKLSSPRSTSANQQSNYRDECALCHENSYSSSGKYSWIGCDRCGRWYHIACPERKVKRPMLFALPILYATTKSQEEAIFHCPTCVKNPDAFTKAVSVQLSIFLDKAMQLKENFENRLQIEPVRPTESGTNDILQKQNETLESKCQALKRENENLKREIEDLNFRLEAAEEFKPASQDKFRGYDQQKVEELFREIEERTVSYTRNICQRQEQSGNVIHHPFAEWHSLDPECDSPGRQWFSSEHGAVPEPGQHTSLTAAFRKILKIPEGQRLRIDPRIKTLKLHLVYRSFVWWFIFDIFFDLKIDNLPNMKLIRAMGVAARGFAKDRWPNNVADVEKEVLLRSWYKLSFQDAVAEEKELLRISMEKFLAPFTRKFPRTDDWSSEMEDIIWHIIRLWTYLWVLGGKQEPIHPSIGDPFDPKQHEAIGIDSDELTREELSKLNVSWIVSRGLRYRDGHEGRQAGIIKAGVVVA